MKIQKTQDPKSSKILNVFCHLKRFVEKIDLLLKRFV